LHAPADPISITHRKEGTSTAGIGDSPLRARIKTPKWLSGPPRFHGTQHALATIIEPLVGNYSSSGTLVCCQLPDFIINSQIQVLMGSDHEGINNSQGKDHFATPVDTLWPARFQTAGNLFAMYRGQSGTQIKLPPIEKSFDNIT